MNKVVDDLLKNIKEFEASFNEYEKQFYPEIRKERQRLMIYFILWILFIIGAAIVFQFFPKFVCLRNILIFLTIIFTVLILFYTIKFDEVSVGVPSKFTKLCDKVKYRLKYLYGDNAKEVADMLVNDLSEKRNSQLQKYENIVKAIGTIGKVLVTATITLALNRLFVEDKTNISGETFGNIIIIVAIMVILIKLIDSGIKKIIKYPVFGKASKEVYLTDILYEVKYMILEKEDN